MCIAQYLKVIQSFGNMFKNCTFKPLCTDEGICDPPGWDPAPLEEFFNRNDNATYNVILPLICVLGFLGNLVSILILSRSKFKTKILYAYLKGLAIVDLIYLFLTFFYCLMIIHK